jgi:hypothetical protein
MGAVRAPVLAWQIAIPLLLLAAWQLAAMLAGDFYIATPADAVGALDSDWFYGSLGATLFAAFAGPLAVPQKLLGRFAVPGGVLPAVVLLTPAVLPLMLLLLPAMVGT